MSTLLWSVVSRKHHLLTMRLIIVLFVLFTISSATLIPENFEVDQNIDTNVLMNHLLSVLKHKIPQLGNSPKNAINDMITEWLENAREQFGVGFPDQGIPPLDPFELDYIDFQVAEGFILKVNIILRDIIVRGLKEFIISHINFRIIAMTLEYEFLIPKIDYNSKFEVNGSVASIINVNPKGEAILGLEDFKTWGSIRLSVNGTGYLQLANFNIDFDAEKFSVYLEGLFENGQINNILNWILEQLSDDFFEGQRERLREFATETLSEIIADFVSDIKLTDLFPTTTTPSSVNF